MFGGDEHSEEGMLDSGGERDSTPLKYTNIRLLLLLDQYITSISSTNVFNLSDMTTSLDLRINEDHLHLKYS